MSILFAILFVLNIIHPENVEFVETTIENNKKYECSFVYKGLSRPTSDKAMTLYGYTLFKESCKQ